MKIIPRPGFEQVKVSDIEPGDIIGTLTDYLCNVRFVRVTSVHNSPQFGISFRYDNGGEVESARFNPSRPVIRKVAEVCIF